MKRAMVMGRTGAGKTTLLNALVGNGSLGRRKTQMVEYHDWAVDTPGEYTEMPRFYNYLISTAFRSAVVLVIQDAVAPRAILPPAFCNVFGQKPMIGVVTKVDLPEAVPERAEAHLRAAGVPGPYVRVSSLTGFGIEELRTRIQQLTEGGLTSDV